jgi:uncharacterized protein (TIGR00369 family)
MSGVLDSWFTVRRSFLSRVGRREDVGTWSDLLEALVAHRDDALHLAALRLPMLDGWEDGRVWATWPVERDFLTPAVGSLFGGYVAALADHLLACAAFTVLEDDETFTTSEMHVHFLRSVRDGVLEIEATVVSRSRLSAYCEVTMVDLAGKLVARAGATQVIRPPTGR